ncbi:MAG: sigma-70 family RNA polymerase sigma factor [Gemmatimonadota bacterium]
MAQPAFNPVDRREVAQLYVAHAPEMIRIATRILHDVARAQDAVHEVFSKLPEDFLARVPAPKRRRYLFRAVRREAWRVLDRLLKQAPLANAPEAGTPRPRELAVAIGAAALQRLLAEIVDDLPPKQRAAVRLTTYEEHSLAEAAAELNATPKALEKRKTAAYRNIKNALLAKGISGFDDVSSFLDGGGVRGLVG